MRRTSKASSVGSNSGRAQGPWSLHRPGALVALAVALLASACLLPGAALAAESRLPVESFGPDGTSGTTFSFPGALAFDQGEERLYALDQGGGQIHGFDTAGAATHTPLGGAFPLTAPGSEPGYVDGLAADSSSHDLYFLSEAKAFSAEPSLYGFDATGAPRGGNFPIGGFGDPCGAAVDPSGHVWVAGNLGGGVLGVTEYDSAGNPLDTVIADQGFPCHIAFDSQANLYVGMYFGPIWRYDAADGYASATEVSASPSNALTVDRSTDRLYAAHPGSISVYDADGTFLYSFGADVAGAEYAGIAIDEASEEVYVSDRSNLTIQVFGAPFPLPDVRTEDAEDVVAGTATLHGTVNPQGEQLTECRFEYGTTSSYGQSAPCDPAAASIPADSAEHALSAELSGLDPGTTYHFRLAAATAEGSVDGLDRVFTTAIGPPLVGEQSVDAVGVTGATVSAEINPKGARTTYHVEYGPTASYGQSTPESQPIGFGTDDSDHLVSVQIGGLAPGTAYHFRFVATSPAGTDTGEDASFATYPRPSSFEPCPNERFRVGLGARLPDCRAYEQATPIDKHGANAQGFPDAIRASSAGDRVSFYVNGGLATSGGSSSLAPFLASRDSTGWSYDGLLIATAPGENAGVIGWSDDLSTTAVLGPEPGNALYLRDSDTAAFELASSQSLGLEAKLAAFSGDPEHLILESNRAVAPGAVPGKNNLYDLDHGALTLAARIPAGSAASCDDAGGPACVPAPEGSFAGPYSWQNSNSEVGGANGDYYTQNTISRDGSRVFFTAAGSGQLYVREDGTATTRVSASQRTVPDPNGEKPAAFMAATPDGSKVFFASCEKLTDDSTAFSTSENACTATDGIQPGIGTALQGQDLYSYDLDTGELTDLTVDAGDEKGAAVQGVLGASEDGSYVYFVANGALAPGASSGDCTIGFQGHGDCNLYVSHDGTTKFIASVSKGPEGENWEGRKPPDTLVGMKPSRVSADGNEVLFGSAQSLTGYDNMSSVCGAFFEKGPCKELFRYSAAEEGLTCVSCNPTGLPPGGHALVGTSRKFFGTSPKTPLLTRNLSADGNRVFFDSPDPLVPSDTNGVTDVYEWEAEGSGSCETAGGCLYVLSGGTNQSPAYFADASADGEHVFLFSEQQLVPGDRDRLYDVYDAGAGAGLAAQHALAPPTCETTACQDNPAPPPEPSTASAVFSGAGNARGRPAARRCPKGKRKVRRGGKVRCQKRSKQSKQSKRHANRGGSK